MRGRAREKASVDEGIGRRVRSCGAAFGRASLTESEFGSFASASGSGFSDEGFFGMGVEELVGELRASRTRLLRRLEGLESAVRRLKG